MCDEVKFVQESGVARLWEVVWFNLVARCSVLLPDNLIKTSVCVCVCVKLFLVTVIFNAVCLSQFLFTSYIIIECFMSAF